MGFVRSIPERVEKTTDGYKQRGRGANNSVQRLKHFTEVAAAQRLGACFEVDVVTWTRPSPTAIALKWAIRCKGPGNWTRVVFSGVILVIHRKSSLRADFLARPDGSRSTPSQMARQSWWYSSVSRARRARSACFLERPCCPCQWLQISRHGSHLRQREQQVRPA
jgi:hypothetical protein